MKPTRMTWLAAVAALIVACPAVARSGSPSPTAAARTVILDYANADVADVLRALATQSRVNIALSPGVRGLVTVHLRDKTVDDAIQVVANLAGLAMRRVNDTYVVAQRADMRQTIERLGRNRVVNLTHMPPPAAVSLVESAFPDLTARPHSRGVVLIGADADIEPAEQMLTHNDVPTPDQVRVSARVELKHRAAAPLAASLAKMTPRLSAEVAGTGLVLSGTRAEVEAATRAAEMMDVPSEPTDEVRVYSVKYVNAGQLIELLTRAVPDVKVMPGPEANNPEQPKFNILSGQLAGTFVNDRNERDQALNRTTGAGPAVSRRVTKLVLKGTPAHLDAAMRLLELTDTPPRQMLVEARIVETSPELAEQIGLRWSWERFRFAEHPLGTPAADIGATTRPLPMGQITRVPLDFGAELDALIRHRESRLLANPKLTALNDEDASIFIGDTLRVRVLAQSSATAGSQFTVLEVPVGIVLLVRPRANDDDTITLRVHPVVSTLTGFVDGLPQTVAREADTSVRVQDGDTLVIGGLIQESDMTTMEKIPVLGDLPFIGQLFRHRDRSHRRTEVMVFLTVRMLR
ncbi:MAG TPA: hypothetical protein VLH79_02815 [Chthonomonadales bacterium]|nr:hypothetical protein [Chthonomonadales bacterium]